MRHKLIAGIIVLIGLCVSAHAQESMKFDNEAKKLDFIRQMLKKERHLRLSEDSARHCKPMMKDLLVGKNYKAIEPYLRADSEDDPRLAKWNQCRHKDYQDMGVDADKFFGWLPELGGPPYRFYRIDLDGNRKNGPEDMVYHETPSGPHESGDTGYAWVDLKKCEIKGGFPATGSVSRWSTKANAIYLNTLVYYKGKLWAVDFIDGFSISFFKRIDRNLIVTCRWQLFDPKTASEDPDDE